MPRYDTILFDLDGTLLDTLQDMTDSVNYTMRQYGFAEHHAQAVRSFIGNGVRRLIELSLPQGEQTDGFEQIYHTYLTHYAANCNNKTQPYPGMMDALDALAMQGCRMGIVSNKPDDAVKELCAEFFSRYIHVAIGESSRTRKKPAPDTVLIAMDHLGAQAQGSVYIGDSEVDILTGRNAGLDVISVTWGFRDRCVLEQNGAVMLADTIDQMLHCLR